MHSNDFRYQFTSDGDERQIDGKTQAEWEQEFGIVGLIEAMSKLGWQRYQWDHTSDQTFAEFQEKNPTITTANQCFAEFFSIYYRGYLRGDGKTVREAVEQCLQTAQRYAGCESNNPDGHYYVPYRRGKSQKEYENGLLMCKYCGFAGHTSLVGHLVSENESLKISLDVAKDMAAKEIQHYRENGMSFSEGIQKGLKEVLDRLSEKKDDS
jgi:hypothetical protein